MKVHPVAELFPMLPDDELAELAEDIRLNGQEFPIVKALLEGDEEETLIDGRNRYAACELIGVEPKFTQLPPGKDPVAFILSTNVQRRHLTKSQTAMSVARAKLFQVGKVWGDQGALAKEIGITQGRISEASAVLAFAPELADAVMTGATPLSEAYETARQRKQSAQAADDAAKEEAQRATAAAKKVEQRMSALRKRYPDLAEQVAEERLSLNEAEAAGEAREKDHADRVRSANAYLSQVLNLLWQASLHEQRATDIIALATLPNVGGVRPWNRETAESVARYANALAQATARLEETPHGRDLPK